MRICLVVLLSVMLGVWPAMAEIFEGPGPDPACEGTSLTIEKKGRLVTKITYGIFGSFAAVVEEYTPRAEGGWDVVVSVYSTKLADGTPIKQSLVKTYRFINTDTGKAQDELNKAGMEKFDWKNEPGRLIGYFEKNRKEFERSPE